MYLKTVNLFEKLWKLVYFWYLCGWLRKSIHFLWMAKFFLGLWLNTIVICSLVKKETKNEIDVWTNKCIITKMLHVDYNVLNAHSVSPTINTPKQIKQSKIIDIKFRYMYHKYLSQTYTHTTYWFASVRFKSFSLLWPPFLVSKYIWFCSTPWLWLSLNSFCGFGNQSDCLVYDISESMIAAYSFLRSTVSLIIINFLKLE